MLVASENQVLSAFEKIHGEMSGGCHAAVVYDDRHEIVGVACMKDGIEAWRSSIAEITFDLLIINMHGKEDL